MSCMAYSEKFHNVNSFVLCRSIPCSGCKNPLNTIIRVNLILTVPRNIERIIISFCSRLVNCPGHPTYSQSRISFFFSFRPQSHGKMRTTHIFSIVLLPWLCAASIQAGEVPKAEHSAFTPLHLRELKNRTKTLFNHGWDSYMTYGFPADEVLPVTCEPYGPQFADPTSIHNDAMGNVSSTILDSLDTLMIMGEWQQLERVLKYLKKNEVSFFDQDYVVQVFEASIRWMGGLLLAHLALTDNVLTKKDPVLIRIISQYDGFLLRMAYDLGLRLIPSYNTSTSLPLPRINLAKGLDGVPSSADRIGCTAGCTTPLLEFSLLLKLTGDERFETLTNATFWKLWGTRLELGLLPMTVDPASNKWLDVVTGVGALVDSFYEYSVKASIVLQDQRFWDVFALSYNALMSHLAVFTTDHSWMLFSNVQVSTPDRSNLWIDLLSAFWPGLQVLAGRLSDAVSTHLVFLKIWDHFDSIPERWEERSLSTPKDKLKDQVKAAIPLEWYPLRPEFIESTYYLYRATKDPMYLQIGLRILTLFETQYKTTCGFSGFQDIRTGLKQNRMETFVLGELLKYLYLLFDEGNDSYVHGKSMSRKNWVFSTEAHPLWYREEFGATSRESFKSNLISKSIDYTNFLNNGILSSMWLEIIKTFGGTGPTDPAPPVEMERHDLFGSNLRPAAEALEVCEVRPQQWRSDPDQHFQSSGFCDWDQLFALNNHLATTLVRPAHLEPYRNNSVIELTPSFLKTQCFSREPRSRRIATTASMDFSIGKLVRPEAYEIYRVHETQRKHIFKTNDLVMPQFGGRLKLEKLVENRITRDNTVVPPKNNERHSTDLYRVHMANGHRIMANGTLWTEGASLLRSLAAFKINERGQILIEGRLVENLKAY